MNIIHQWMLDSYFSHYSFTVCLEQSIVYLTCILFSITVVQSIVIVISRGFFRT